MQRTVGQPKARVFRAAFALIELLVVVAIIGILAALMLGAMHVPFPLVFM